MLVTWALFAIWVTVNVLDIMISLVAVQLGASEVGVLFLVSHSWLTLVVSKMGIALLLGLALVYFKQDGILALIDAGMVCLCIYLVVAVFQQM